MTAPEDAGGQAGVTRAAGAWPALTATDVAAVTGQLGRPLRGETRCAHRCPCGRPDVVATRPRLPDGTPFPTLYYLTCPYAVAAASRLEAAGVMREMTDRLAADPQLAADQRDAHEAYLADRAAWQSVPEIATVSAGGMPDRVKCLHALAAHALAAGRGVNRLGDEVLDRVGPWWTAGSCAS